MHRLLQQVFSLNAEARIMQRLEQALLAYVKTGVKTGSQLSTSASLGIKARPAVLARGIFGMLRYDATATLKSMMVPTLVIAGDHDPCANQRQVDACATT